MPPVQNALPTPNAVLRGPFGSLVIVASGVDAGGLWRFKVFAPLGGAPTSSQNQANHIVQELARSSTDNPAAAASENSPISRIFDF